MSFVINTNTAATEAASSLSRTNNMLQKSLSRLSTGVRIVSPSDDAGGLAVSMKMNATIIRTGAVLSNVGNALSFLQTQDGSLKTVSSVLDRMSELKTLESDPTKSAGDKSNYQTEFTALQEQLTNLKAEKFNGVDLFGSTALSVGVTEDGSSTVSVSQANLGTSLTVSSNDMADSSNTIGDFSVANFTTAIESVATLRAANGAQSSQLNFAAETLTINKSNLESANSRIIDTDVADESTKFARFNILQQSGVAMLAQANASSQAALRLIS